jgi:predicted DNA-binding transcriptional regulator AlpA
MKFNSSNNLLSPIQVSDILGISLGTLAVWRCTRRVKLPYVKVGRRVMYKQKAIDDFIERQTFDNEAA